MMPGRYTEKARKLKYISTLYAPFHPQFALAEFLSTNRFERHLRSMVALYQKKQSQLLNAIQHRLPKGTKATQPQGGFLCWLQLPKTINAFTLYQHAIKRGLSVLPGELCSPSGRYKNYIRLNYAVASAEQIDTSMKTIADIINIQAEI